MRRKWSERATTGADGDNLAARIVRAARMSGAPCARGVPCARGTACARSVAYARGVALGLALGSLTVLSACASSAPLRYYTLSEVPAATDATGATSATPAIRVGRVRIPGELDRNEIVQQIDAT